MTTLLSLHQVAELLATCDNYLVLSHRRPDGDTVGCSAALCLALRAMGKQAWVYPNPQFTPKFAPYLEGLLAPESVLARLRSADPARPGVSAGGLMLLSCDIAGRGLFPFGMEDAQVLLAIDHHGTNEGFAVYTHVEADKAACGEILVDLFALLGLPMTQRVAETLYVAISTDTGCFRYSNVTANTFRCASACVAAGADIYPINRAFFEVKRRPRLELEAYLTKTMEFMAGGKVAISAIPPQVISDLELTEDDIDDISGFGRSVEGVEIAVMLREVENGMGKVSVRTSPEYNAARICGRIGGGGHPSAAGASVPGGIPGIRRAVLGALREEINLQWQTASSL